MSGEALKERHLADLHALAAELNVSRYRLLARDELVEEIAARGGAEPGPEGDEAREVEQAEAAVALEDAREAEEAEAGAEPGPAVGAPAEAEDAKEEGEPVAGVLDVMPQGFGFLRLQGLEPDPGDIYVSASQIRRCEMRPGDRVSGPARAPRRGERHRALIHVETVEGVPPGAVSERPSFERLTPVTATRRLRLDSEPQDLPARAVDLLAPLALGQRVLVLAQPRSGRTTLLRSVARAAAAAPEGPEITVLLFDERPEEVTEWRRQMPAARVAAAPADRTASEQMHVAELALARAKREAEAGADVMMLVDSLSRIALGYRDPAEVKHFFGAGRELEEEGAGSLTIVATVVAGGGADATRDAVSTTENSLISLDARLVAKGIFPPIVVEESGVSDEDRLRDPDELAAIRRLRESLAGRDASEAAQLLAERLAAAATNAELLASL